MWKIFTYSPCTPTFCLFLMQNDLSWHKQSIHGKLSYSLVCLFYAKNKLQMCRVTQHQCRSRQMWKIFTNSPSTLTICLYKKMTCLWLNNLFMVRFQLIRMSSYAKNELQMCWVPQHQCRSRQMWKIFTNSPSSTHFLSVTKKWLVLPEQSIHGKLSTH